MKKLLLLLTLLAASWGLPAPASATVSCSVPFNLTNGTVADASQVMANYNAILACLSVSTAASGANSDITSLTAVTSIGPLSTPITPAQGGAQALCGANGYKLVNNTGTPNTQADISWNEAIVTNTSGAIQRGTSGAVTLNFGTSGAINALDAGTIGVRQIWYIWLIGNGTLLNSLASLSPTAPTLPSGYTFKCRVSSIDTDDNSHLLPTATLGNRTRAANGSWATNVATFGFTWTNGVISCGASYPPTTLTAIPLTATAVIGSLIVKANTTGVIATGTILSADTVTAVNTAGESLSLHFEMPVYTAQTVYPCLSSALNFIDITGWVDNTNAH